MIQKLRSFLQRRSAAPVVVRASRPHHDLHALFQMQQQHFGSPIVAHVRWGRWPSNPPERTIRLGSCKPVQPPIIRVHPVLDHPDVPAWFVSFILFHEMLHVAIPPIPPIQGKKRRQVHTPRFRAAERTHPDYDRCMTWEQENVRLLIERIGRDR